jgi:hypothetical protein
MLFHERKTLTWAYMSVTMTPETLASCDISLQNRMPQFVVVLAYWCNVYRGTAVAVRTVQVGCRSDDSAAQPYTRGKKTLRGCLPSQALMRDELLASLSELNDNCSGLDINTPPGHINHDALTLLYASHLLCEARNNHAIKSSTHSALPSRH